MNACSVVVRPHCFGCQIESEHVAPLVPMAVVDPTAGTNPIKLEHGPVEKLFHNCVDGVSATY